MNTPNLENINVHAPYKVRRELSNNYSFYFETDYGLRYTICFMLEYSFVQSGAYQFCINVEGDGRSPGDKKLRQTIFAIIEEFFAVNGSEAMLYLCETGDEKEGLRNPCLFIGSTFPGWRNYLQSSTKQSPSSSTKGQRISCRNDVKGQVSEKILAFFLASFGIIAYLCPRIP